MNIKFVDRRGDQPGNVHFYAEKKVSKLGRFFRQDAEAVITFTNLKKGQVKVEVAVNADGTLFRGENTSSDANASVDAVVAAIERQIRKYKTRLSKRLRTEELSDIPVLEPEDEEETDDIVITRSKRFTIKPMNPEEAVLQMNLLGHNFFVFRNSESGDRIAIVYSRKAGGYGLIEDDAD